VSLKIVAQDSTQVVGIYVTHHLYVAQLMKMLSMVSQPEHVVWPCAGHTAIQAEGSIYIMIAFLDWLLMIMELKESMLISV
jgi:hypothetical protein